MLKPLAAAIESLELAGRGLLVAVSGGVDSIALAAGLRALSQDYELNLSIGHVNHGLRGAESEADEAFVERLAGQWELGFLSERVDPMAATAAGSSRSRPTLQEAARRLRYDALARMAECAGAARMATAHTLDDQAETVLLRLLRGTGPDGLGGIPERSPDGRVVRPLLRVTRAEILAFAGELGLSWREDPSNQNPRFARNRLRHEWLPGLQEAFNPQLLRALGDLAETQRSEGAWLAVLVDREAAHRFEGDGCGGLRIEPKDWGAEALPEALARRLVRLALHRCGAGRHVTRIHLDRALRFLRSARPGRRVELPWGLELRREAHAFRLCRRDLPPLEPC